MDTYEARLVGKATEYDDELDELLESDLLDDEICVLAEDRELALLYSLMEVRDDSDKEDGQPSSISPPCPSQNRNGS